MDTPVIVMGASTGGLETLCEILPMLPPDLAAAVLVVVHTSSEGGGAPLSDMLKRFCQLKVQMATGGLPLVAGTLYIAPSDRHLLVHRGCAVVSRGPRENNVRPAIDPLFRSAAVWAREKCLGAVLTGKMDDGAEGLQAIHRCGGTTIVEDPLTARCGEMPASAIRLQSPDHVLTSAAIVPLLLKLLAAPWSAPPEVPEDLVGEVLLTLRAGGLDTHAGDILETEALGTQVPFSCPECQGTLWQVGQHFRCHVGHSYSSETLLSRHDASLEEALWAAVRAFEERRKMLRRLGGTSYSQRADEAQVHADRIREVLLQMAHARPD